MIRKLADGTIEGDPIEMAQYDFEVARLDAMAKIDRDPARAKFDSALRCSLENVPLEDGVHHKAEALIANELRSHGDAALRVLEKIIAESRPTYGASILQCLGRIGAPSDGRWRSRIVADALSRNDVEIRDAAVQAVENWGDPALIPLLQAHHDDVEWLDTYSRDVVRDLRKRKRRYSSSLGVMAKMACDDLRRHGRELARAHRDSDAEIKRILMVPPVEGDDVVRLLEVTGSVGTTNEILPFTFAARPDEGLRVAMSVTLVSEEEHAALCTGELDLPDGWGAVGDLEELHAKPEAVGQTSHIRKNTTSRSIDDECYGIGGSDRVFSGDAREAALLCLRAAWPNAITEDGDTDIGEIFVYRDSAAREAWQRDGGTVENQNTMIHILGTDVSTTIVTD